MRYTLLILLGLVLFASSAQAQTNLSTSATLRLFTPGVPSAISSQTIAFAVMSCNQTPVTTGSPVNPTKWLFDDPVNAGKQCAYTDPRLATLTDGNYEGTAAFNNPTGAGAESPHVPFSIARPTLPGVPTGVAISR